MRRPRDHRSDRRAGLATLLAAVVIVVLAFGQGLPFRGGYEVTAVFADAADVKPGSPVRIAGVDVGEVTAVRHRPGGEALTEVTVRIEDHGRPLTRDARFSIRPRTFLEGNFFVDVRPGRPGDAELEDGAVVPVAQTAAPVRIGDVLRTLQSDVRRDLQGLLGELDTALSDGGAEALHRSLPEMAPAYEGTAVAADALRGVAADDVPRALDASATALGALDRDPAKLRSLVRDLQATAGALAAARQQLGTAVRELPALLRTSQPALAAVNRALPDLRRLAVAGRPGVRAAGPALRVGTPLAGEVERLLRPSELGGLTRDLRAATPELSAGARDLVPTMRELRAVGSCLTEVVLPWAGDRIEDDAHPAAGRVFQELPKAFGGIGAESRSGDANGQWLRVAQTGATYAYPQGAGSFAFTSRPLGGVNPPPPPRQVPLRADQPCEDQSPPDLRTRPLAPPSGFRVATGSDDAQALLRRGLPAAERALRRLLRERSGGLRAGGRPLEPAGRLLRGADLGRLTRRGR